MPRWCRGRVDQGLFRALPGTVTGKIRFALPPPLITALAVTMIALWPGLGLGLGLQPGPGALHHLPSSVRGLVTSGILPAALIAIALNLILPAELADKSAGEMSGRFAGDSDDA